MSKLDWIKNQQTANKYLECIDTYRTQLQQLNFNEARTALSTIIQNIGADSARTLTRDACKSLRSDVELLLQQN
jgi:3-methyladenine DNA glycosylase AlkD